tara:strand:- start:506 stop:709 length:204 start_codon:yes stop_codon:yes gene_type:complete
MKKEKKPTQNPIICLCNQIRRDTIMQAIRDGVKNTDELYDLTGAGVGPCGGSCRTTTKKWIEDYKKK